MSVALIFILNINISFSQWIIHTLPPGSGKSVSMDFSDIDHGIICGGFIDFNSNARAYYTTNRGASWNASVIPDSGKFFNSVKFVSDNLAYMCGAYQPGSVQIDYTNKLNGSGWKAFFLKSINSGRDWLSSTSHDLSVFNNLESLDFLNEHQGIAIGNSYEIPDGYTDKLIITTNAGINWSVSLPSSDSLNIDLVDVQYVSNNFICSAGNIVREDVYKGILLSSTDEGQHWAMTSIDNLIISRISFTGRYTGFLIGSNSLNSLSELYRTTDGGKSWELIQTFEDNYYTGVTFLKERGIGLLYGYRIFFENPVISLTTDYGVNWNIQSIGPTTDVILSDATIMNPDEMYVTGGEIFSGSLVVHTTNGGMTFVNGRNGTTSSIKFELTQNYPNPFNPHTVIRYSLSENRYVSLKVFDALGKEVATLVTENQNAGTYEADFDGSNFSSGIYFYTLSTDDFTDTKKMFLLK